MVKFISNSSRGILRSIYSNIDGISFFGYITLLLIRWLLVKAPKALLLDRDLKNTP